MAPRSFSLCVVATVLPLLIAAASADAQRRQDDDPAAAQARAFNARARRAFNLGRFRDAAALYKQAYEAKAAPAFLHNIAQCYARMSSVEDLEQALFYFESYLSNAPSSPFRQTVEEERDEIKRRLHAAKAAAAKDQAAQEAAAKEKREKKAQAPAPPRAPPPERPLYKRWWFWTAVGAVLIGATTATAIALQPDDTAPASGNLPPFQFTFE